MGGSPRGTAPHSIAPPEPNIELTMDVVAVLADVSFEVVVLEDLEFDWLLGAEGL